MQFNRASFVLLIVIFLSQPVLAGGVVSYFSDQLAQGAAVTSTSGSLIGVNVVLEIKIGHFVALGIVNSQKNQSPIFSSSETMFGGNINSSPRIVSSSQLASNSQNTSSPLPLPTKLFQAAIFNNLPKSSSVIVSTEQSNLSAGNSAEAVQLSIVEENQEGRHLIAHDNQQVELERKKGFSKFEIMGQLVGPMAGQVELKGNVTLRIDTI